MIQWSRAVLEQAFDKTSRNGCRRERETSLCAKDEYAKNVFDAC